tara:strand:+ start:181 stop:606 length:426 start_codon:yes stop_codon:yes gene_type:complete
MPRYDYVCSSSKCKSSQTIERSYKDRKTLAACLQCGAEAEYEFPMGAAFGVQILDSYYDEALGCDIKGYRHKRQVMKAQGVIEAGDSVGGARNFDKDAKHHIKPLPPKGIDYAPRIKTDANMNMQVENKKGEWQAPKTKDL